MLKNFSIIFVALLLTSCAGITFCDQYGQPKGCHKWDPATTTGAAAR